MALQHQRRRGNLSTQDVTYLQERETAKPVKRYWTYLPVIGLRREAGQDNKEAAKILCCDWMRTEA